MEKQLQVWAHEWMLLLEEPFSYVVVRLIVCRQRRQMVNYFIIDVFVL